MLAHVTLRQAAPIILSQLVGVACGVFGVRLVSHLVPPAELGAYGVFLTFTTLGVWVVHSGLSKFVGRHWAGADRSALLRGVVQTWARKLGWLALAAALGTLVLHRLTLLPTAVVFSALLASAALLSIAALAQTALQAAQQHWHDLGISTVGSITRTFVPPLAFAALGTAGLFFGFAFHAAAFAFAGAIFLRGHWPAGEKPAAAITRVYDGPLFTVLALSGWILAGQNRWLSVWFFGDVVGGLFTLASNIALIIPSLLGAVFLQFFQPRFYALADSPEAGARDQLARQVDRTAAVFCLASLATLAALRAVAPWLVGPLIAPRYAAAIPWLIPTGCFGVATATAGFYHTLLLAGRCEHACGPVELTAAAFLVMGGGVAASVSPAWFAWWLMATPLLPWLVTRPLARRYFFKPVSTATPSRVP